jgi:hypothetical protein
MLGGLTWTQRSTQLLLTARLRNWVLPSRCCRSYDGQRVEVRLFADAGRETVEALPVSDLRDALCGGYHLPGQQPDQAAWNP